MGIIKRTSHRKKSDYVTVEDGKIVVRTPASCTKWSQEFRLRVIRDYIAPKSLRSREDFIKKHVENGEQDKVYRIEGRDVMVRHRYVVPGNISHQLLILHMEVVDVARKKAMLLYHPDPAMRSLMIYIFLHDQHKDGKPLLSNIPSFDVYDYEP